MSILDWLFGTGADASEAQPDIPFGRYTDAFKSKTQLEAWDIALDLFEQGKPLEAYRYFFKYLSDPHENNLSLKDNGDALHFSFFQGSRVVTGVATGEKFRAESKIAQASDFNVGILRRLMEYNFTLRFCRYGLDDDNCLSIVFDSAAVDGSPLKLFHALRELSLSADKQDDLLLDEFRNLKPVGATAVIDIPESEKEIKHRFIVREIESAFALIDRGRPDPNQYPGGYAYMLLALAFRLDYLIRPEGFMMDTLERIHGIYFSKDERSVPQKITALRKEFQKLLDRPKEDLFREMYRTSSTFSISPPVHHDRIKGLIEGELPNMDWHLNQQHEALALAVPQYIAGYALFHYVPPKPVREMLQLFFRITDSGFMEELGFKPAFCKPDGTPDKKLVARSLRRIVNLNKKEFPALRAETDALNFNSQAHFAKSYLELIKNLNLSREA